MNDEVLDPRRQRAAELDQLFYTLMDDVKCALVLWEHQGDEFAHRTYVRTVFTLVEGMIQFMKEGALLFDQFNHPPVLTQEEVVLLREEEVFLKSNGRVGTKKSKLQTLPNLKFAIDCYSRVFGVEFTPNYSGQGWEDFQAGRNIRDRITHPKSVADLSVSLEEIKTVEAGMKFFREATAPLLHRQ